MGPDHRFEGRQCHHLASDGSRCQGCGSAGKFRGCRTGSRAARRRPAGRHLGGPARAGRRPHLRQLERQVVDCWEGLTRFGVRRGDRIVAAMPNGAPAVVLHLAAASLGAVWMGLPPCTRTEEVLACAAAEARLAVVVDGCLGDGRSRIAEVRRLAGLRERYGTTVVLLPQLDPDSYVAGIPGWERCSPSMAAGSSSEGSVLVCDAGVAEPRWELILAG
ncbi:MAG TPA: AMP-binding protein, partial [Amycolatopsis sp.]|nr:AMP-binding protein [Amycolatopsis sp.]